jgi:hypothetical protein
MSVVLLHVKRTGVRALQSVDIDTSVLPPQLRMLIKHLGFGPAVQLVQERGGIPTYVPSAVTREHADHDLCVLLGPEAFAALVEHYGGTSLCVPKADSLIKQARHQHVRVLLAKRMPTAQIARATGYCVRSIELIAAGRIETELQGDLFEGFAQEVRP